MRTIYKYPIQITDRQIISFPNGAILLHAALDPNGDPCIWAEVNSRVKATYDTTVFVVGTGNPIPEGAIDHLGSFAHGPFMWHIYTR